MNKMILRFLDTGVTSSSLLQPEIWVYSRLPAWIKSARHRKDVLKALLRLEQMVSTLQPLHYSTPYYSEKRS